MRTTTAYPALAHLWTVGWVALGSVYWLLPVHLTGSDDPTQVLRDSWRLLWVFVFAANTAMLAELLVPLVALVPALRSRPWLVGLLAAGAAAVPVVGIGTGRF